MGDVVLVTGGARSGKSRWALDWAQSEPTEAPRIFIATAQSTDPEMAERITRHRQERGEEWETVEAGVHAAAAIDDLPEGATAILDCCTVWLGNVWHEKGGKEETLAEAINEFVAAVANWRDLRQGSLCLVTNEVGSGIVPCDSGVRLWRDWSGRMNQWLAQAADRVVLCVCGLPVEVKSTS